MKIEVLVATMNQTDHSLPSRMGIETDALIGNQCDRLACEEFTHAGHRIVMYSCPERGVGLNRNQTLLRAGGDILLFADEDEQLSPGYEAEVLRAFAENKKADCLIFNIRTIGNDGGRRHNTRVKRIRFHNALNYGAVRIAVRRSAISREGLTFNQNFGGGTPFSCGEDNLFIFSMLKHRLRLYTHPYVIGTVDQSVSSWFSGYCPKYFYDKGVLFAALSGRFARLLCLRELLCHPENYRAAGLSFNEAKRLMYRGIRAFSTLCPYKEGTEPTKEQ